MEENKNELENQNVETPVVEATPAPVAQVEPATPAEPTGEAAPLLGGAPVVEEKASQAPTIDEKAKPKELTTEEMMDTPINVEVEKKKSSKVPFIIIIVIVVLAACGGAYIYMTTDNKKKEEKQEQQEQKQEEKKDEEKEEEPVENNNEEIKVDEKIDNFMKYATYNKGFEDVLYKGVNSLTTKFKYDMTVYASDSVKITEETLPEKYKGTEEETYLVTEPEPIMITFDEFNKKFKEFFKEDTDLKYMKDHSAKVSDDEKLGACPFLYIVDEEIKQLIFSYQCGGLEVEEYNTKIYDYKKDANNYYVYTYVARHSEDYKKLDGTVVDVDTFDGNEDKFSTVVWTFDKDYNFVSTQVK